MFWLKFECFSGHIYVIVEFEDASIGEKVAEHKAPVEEDVEELVLAILDRIVDELVERADLPDKMTKQLRKESNE